MNFKTYSTRAGITLMEVLISIGILAVGLTAVITIIPAAGSQAQKALTETNKANVGLAALNDAITRGILTPSSLSPPGGPPFVVDPKNPYLDADQDGENDKDQSGNLLYFWPSAGLPLQMLAGLSGIAADDVFRSQDDVSYTLENSDQDEPPQPLFYTGNAKRLSEGVYSWLATLVRQGGENYLLSVVSFHRRDTIPPVAYLVGEDANGNGNLNMGEDLNQNSSLDLDLTGTNTVMFAWTGSSGAFRETFPRGSIVLLHDVDDNGTAANLGDDTHHSWEWRRVIFPALNDANNSARLMFDSDVSTTVTTRYIYAFKGAVGVAERLVRLEGTSPWTQ
jgi:type II secretory pathway pseudopilin PulG